MADQTKAGSEDVTPTPEQSRRYRELRRAGASAYEAARRVREETGAYPA